MENYITNRRRTSKKDTLDFYPTPEYATRKLLEVEEFRGQIWEPACGNGAVSKILKEKYSDVISSDIIDRGYGDFYEDFLQTGVKSNNIITNPPYNIVNEFTLKCLDCTSNKVALLLRLAFLEGAKRKQTIFDLTPPNRIWVFSKRLTFYPEGVEKAGSGTTAYAWFVFDKDCIDKDTKVDWL